MLGGHLQSLKWRINQFPFCTIARDSLDPWIPRSSWLQGGTCQHFLCALYKHTKVNQLFEDAEGKSLTSVMNFCSKPNSIKELGRRLNVHEHGSFPSSRQGNIWKPAVLSVSSSFHMHYDSSDWSKSAIPTHREWARERKDNLGPGVSLGTCEVFSWLEGGTREGPAKFVLGRLLMKDSQSSRRNSQAPSSPLSEPASPQEAACPAMGRSGRLKLSWREKSVRHLLLGNSTFTHSSGIPAASRKWIMSKHGAWSRDGEPIYTRFAVVQITLSNDSGL